MLQLLGTPRLRGARLKPARAGLLAYLALQGTSDRSLLSQLLYPVKDPPNALNNLAALLARGRETLGGGCIVGQDPLSLPEDLTVDVRLLEASLARKDYVEAVRYDGTLLEGCEFDDLDPDDDKKRLHHWLRGQRARIEGLQCAAHLGLIRQLEQERDYQKARDLARMTCIRFQVFEMRDGPWLSLIHLHRTMGDRAAALDACREYEARLRERTGAALSPEVQEIAKALECPPPLPSTLLRPPRLVGRERERTAMEAAFRQGKPMFVFGEAGVGKSTLMAEFAASKGEEWIALGAKPGDGTIPYASHVRNGKALLARRKKDGRPPLPLWVQEQLAYHLGGPDLGMERPRAPASPPEKIPFFEAATELFRDTCQDMAVVIFDDGQYIDPESFELGMYIHTQLQFGDNPGGKPFPPIINGYRGSDIQPRWMDIIRDLADRDQVAWIELRPLELPQVSELLQSLNLPGLEKADIQIARYTGGNPLYVVETVKALRQGGWMPGTRPPAPMLAESVRHLIRGRLTALSPLALSIARVVAVAQTNTSAKAVARALGRPPTELVEAYRELEEQGVLLGDWFTHDVLGEVILEDVPEALRDVLRPERDGGDD